MSITFHAVPVPAADEPLDGLFGAVIDLDLRSDIARYGDDDLIEHPEAAAAGFRQQSYYEKTWLAARDGHDLVGVVRLDLPLRDNTDVVEWSASIEPSVPDQGRVWTALLDQAREHAVAHGRTVLQGWSSHPLAGGDAAVHRPESGSGYLALDPAAKALLAGGHVLEQVERHSVLDLRSFRDGFAPLEAAALSAAGSDYEALTWTGATPDEWCESMARLRARMSVDIPNAGLENEEQAWDAERVREMDRTVMEQGHRHLMSAVRHVPTDELVAYSVLNQSATRPAAAWQGDTLVHGEHRGHRLGMLVKIANLRSAERHAPGLERVHTWNAGENAHMLAINTALGFRLRTMEGIWQLRLS